MATSRFRKGGLSRRGGGGGGSGAGLSVGRIAHPQFVEPNEAYIDYVPPPDDQDPSLGGSGIYPDWYGWTVGDPNEYELWLYRDSSQPSDEPQSTFWDRMEAKVGSNQTLRINGANYANLTVSKDTGANLWKVTGDSLLNTSNVTTDGQTSIEHGGSLKLIDRDGINVDMEEQVITGDRTDTTVEWGDAIVGRKVTLTLHEDDHFLDRLVTGRYVWIFLSDDSNDLGTFSSDDESHLEARHQVVSVSETNDTWTFVMNGPETLYTHPDVTSADRLKFVVRHTDTGELGEFELDQGSPKPAVGDVAADGDWFRAVDTAKSYTFDDGVSTERRITFFDDGVGNIYSTNVGQTLSGVRVAYRADGQTFVTTDLSEEFTTGTITSPSTNVYSFSIPESLTIPTLGASADHFIIRYGAGANILETEVTNASDVDAAEEWHFGEPAAGTPAMPGRITAYPATAQATAWQSIRIGFNTEPSPSLLAPSSQMSAVFTPLNYAWDSSTSTLSFEIPDSISAIPIVGTGSLRRLQVYILDTGGTLVFNDPVDDAADVDTSGEYHYQAAVDAMAAPSSGGIEELITTSTTTVTPASFNFSVYADGNANIFAHPANIRVGLVANENAGNTGLSSTIALTASNRSVEDLGGTPSKYRVSVGEISGVEIPRLGTDPTILRVRDDTNDVTYNYATSVSSKSDVDAVGEYFLDETAAVTSVSHGVTISTTFTATEIDTYTGFKVRFVTTNGSPLDSAAAGDNVRIALYDRDDYANHEINRLFVDKQSDLERAIHSRSAESFTLQGIGLKRVTWEFRDVDIPFITVGTPEVPSASIRFATRRFAVFGDYSVWEEGTLNAQNEFFFFDTNNAVTIRKYDYVIHQVERTWTIHEESPSTPVDYWHNYTNNEPEYMEIHLRFADNDASIDHFNIPRNGTDVDYLELGTQANSGVYHELMPILLIHWVNDNLVKITIDVENHPEVTRQSLVDRITSDNPYISIAYRTNDPRQLTPAQEASTIAALTTGTDTNQWFIRERISRKPRPVGFILGAHTHLRNLDVRPRLMLLDTTLIRFSTVSEDELPEGLVIHEAGLRSEFDNPDVLVPEIYSSTHFPAGALFSLDGIWQITIRLRTRVRNEANGAQAFALFKATTGEDDRLITTGNSVYRSFDGDNLNVFKDPLVDRPPGGGNDGITEMVEKIPWAEYDPGDKLYLLFGQRNINNVVTGSSDRWTGQNWYLQFEKLNT